MLEETYYTVLGILAQKGYEKTCLDLIEDKVNDENIENVLEIYKKYEMEYGDVSANPGLYYKYLDILEQMKNKYLKRGIIMELYKGKYWDVVFGDWCQEFVGYCIISSNRESLSDLTNEEWIELGLLEKELERVCKKLFNATMFNFSCLMNNAYKDNERPHVHYHFVPRYKDEIHLFNKRYKDRHFGYNFWKWSLSKLKRQKDIFTKNEKIKIYEMMKKEFNIEEVNNA